ncbi:MAG: hypothetical protein ACFFFY_02230 [Promethearchaeota archaeon]
MTRESETEAMEKTKNYKLKRLGLTLTKKSAIYLALLSSIGLSFFAVSIMFTFPVLQYNITNIYPDDKLTFFYMSLLLISNFIASALCICIFGYTLSKVRNFRKALKDH